MRYQQAQVPHKSHHLVRFFKGQVPPVGLNDVKSNADYKNGVEHKNWK